MRTLWNRWFALAALLALGSVAAAAKPNFTGEWKLNTTKSDFGQMPAPSSMAGSMSHEDPKLTTKFKQVGDMGEFSWEAAYTTDGKESTNKGFGDNPMVSVVKWDGDALTFDTKGRFGDNDFTMKDKWTLSADGKVLTMSRHFASAMGEGDQTLVFEKQ